MMNLSVDEKIRLSHAEARIESGLGKVDNGLREAWSGFAIIRDDKLYRETHRSFEAYCQERWDKGRNYINKLIAAGETIANLEAHLGTSVPLPQTEYEVRPIASLPAEQQAEAWEAAATIAPDQKPTSKHTARAATAVKAKALPLEPGQAVTVLTEESPHYGQTVTVRSTQGVVVEAETADGEKVALLTNELTLDRPKPQPAPAQPKYNPVEGLDFKLRLTEEANDHLERENVRLKAIVQQAIGLFEAYEFDEDEDVQTWLTEAKQAI